MAWKIALATVALLASPSLATWSAYQEYLASVPGKADLQRPEITYDGHQPYQPLPDSPKRHRECKVKSHNDFKTDDSQHVLDALYKCNDGGKVVFPAGRTYVIGKALDLSFLKHIDIGRAGRHGLVW